MVRKLMVSAVAMSVIAVLAGCGVNRIVGPEVDVNGQGRHDGNTSLGVIDSDPQPAPEPGGGGGIGDAVDTGVQMWRPVTGTTGSGERRVVPRREPALSGSDLRTTVRN